MNNKSQVAKLNKQTSFSRASRKPARTPSSTEVPASALPNAFYFGFSGNRILGAAAQKDFFKAVDLALKKTGFGDDSSNFSLQTSGKKTFTADASAVSRVAVFILLESASWVLQKVFDKIYKPHIRPNAVKLFKNFLSKESPNLNKPCFDFSTWLEPLQIMITIRISGSSIHGVLMSENKAEQAFDFAQKWLANKGATHKYITVVVHDGILLPIPILSNDPPSRLPVTHFP